MDKILQFKGLKPQKNDYLASIHKTSQVPNERNNNNNELDLNTGVFFIIILTGKRYIKTVSSPVARVLLRRGQKAQ